MRLMVADMTSIANVTPNIEPSATSAETTSDSTTKSSTRADRTISASSANAIGSTTPSPIPLSRSTAP